ncbi:ubiquinol-cytochrome c reductase iron-sulfur subunit [Bradyrhizobium sp.]|uniref:QcrA and Rieske domain-containing protein n=1 Tax=Bradyrhizobium sp. TaxID=376 RepID=UPI001EC20689|nr:ubiquinol-cytochrome c reductase iron-sulfur subunit [Bradyrhizobium sp.]MBV8918189.1 ubiquinol-cytochrome c reductase iron-sulfur subunit [Bradyrhizobium sp.]MBV9983901.1 ubiquinol-cytochrome c reductase iron-sulfur subunit [Bradyrhizobium sp.]
MPGCDGKFRSCSEYVKVALGAARPDKTRRVLILAAAAAGACLTIRPLAAEDDRPGSDERPKAADLLVFYDGDRQGEIIKPDDLTLGGPPVHAWAKDPKTSVIRDGSRLNEILLVRLAPADIDEDTQPSAADGILAYSAICTHAGCSVTEWVDASAGEGQVFKCPCHNSEFDPRHGASVVFGPAPRRLAMLPLAISEGSLIVARPFVGKVGAQQPG